MDQTERALDRSKLGNLKPTAELRKSMEESEICRVFFEQGGFREYLKSLNECYFDSGGEIVGPKNQFADTVVAEGGNSGEKIGLLELGDKAWGGITASLDIRQLGELDFGVTKKVFVVLYYNSKESYFYLELGARVKEECSGQDVISIGRHIRRFFYLNPKRIGKNIDNLLLDFTSELLDLKII